MVERVNRPQRELNVSLRVDVVGHAKHDFAHGLRAALRQAPKVILVGEMRDQETVKIALSAAETGHLVLSTLHTIDAGQTINRILGMFEPEEQEQVRIRLADTMRWIISQRIAPKVGGGRHALLEIMGCNLRVQESIRENLRNSADQVLRNAYYEVARNRSKVENYYAQSIVAAAGKK